MTFINKKNHLSGEASCRGLLRGHNWAFITGFSANIIWLALWLRDIYTRLNLTSQRGFWSIIVIIDPLTLLTSLDRVAPWVTLITHPWLVVLLYLGLMLRFVVTISSEKLIKWRTLLLNMNFVFPFAISLFWYNYCYLVFIPGG